VSIYSSFNQKYALSNLKGEYIVYDLNQRITFASSGALNKKFTVGPTLFPYISLIAMESGAVRSDDQECIRMLKNEGVNFSAVPQRQTDYFIQLMELIGKDKLSTWLSKINFGLFDKETFNGFPYLNNCLKISLESQLSALKSLYFFNLPFSYQSMIEVKKIFLLKKFGEKELHFFETSGGDQTWLMGWFTVKKYTYFFVQHTEILDDKSTSFRTPYQMLGDLFYRLGYIESEECTQLGF
jgi:beta-lactamase class D